MTDPDLVATVEAAAIIGVERSTLSRWAENARLLPAMRLPGKNGAALYRRTDVQRVADEYAATREHTGAAS